MAARPFKPYGTPPPFDLDNYKDTFELWHKRWKLFLALSTIDTALEEDERAVYKAQTLLTSLSEPTLHAVLSMGLTDAQLDDHEFIIKKLKEQCNAGRNRHVWRQQLVLKKQIEGQSVDDWLCELRDIARKCEFAGDCCGECEPTRILGQIVHGVFNDDVRVKLLDKGDDLTLDDALKIVRSAEAISKQAFNIKHGSSAAIQGTRSAHQRSKQEKQRQKGGSRRRSGPPKDNRPPASKQSTGCWNCGAATRHASTECPAHGQVCSKCGRQNHFAKVCKSAPKTEGGGEPGVKTIHAPSSVPRVAAVAADDMVPITISPRRGPTTRVKLSSLPDSGAEIDAIPTTAFAKYFSGVPLHRDIQPETAVGSPIISIGAFRATIDWVAGDGVSRPVDTTIHVLQDLKQPVISKRTQLALGMLPSGYPHRRVDQMAAAAPPGEKSTQQPPTSPTTAPDAAQLPEEPLGAEIFPNLLASVLPAPLRLAAMGNNPSPELKQKDLGHLMAKFPHIFDGKCRPMTGPPCHFQLIEGAVPVPMRGSRPVAVPLMPRLKTELEELEKEGIIRKVDSPTAWVHPIVLVPKKNGGIRLCVDFRELNRCIVRPKFETATPFQAVRTIPPGMKFFTVVDALKGYHQVRLDDESAALTTFSTPFGRFQYLRLPFGVTHAGDDYARRVADVFDDLPSCRRVMEDVLVFSETYEEHVQLVGALFERAAANNIAINTEKIVFAQPSVIFGGYVVDATGFRPDPELTQAVRDFPTPKNITDLRAFFGLCQQVGNFSNKIASSLDPLAPLLKKSYQWEWTSVHDDAFRKARAELSTIPELFFYDPVRPTALHVDASRLHGLGFLLKQDTGRGWRVVQAGSRFLSDPETRYAMIELECLGAAWAMGKCRQFLEGLPSFELVTDHKPLVPILNDYSLDKLDNPRILRLRLKMQRYAFTARWVPGKSNADADALSRAPIKVAEPADELAEGPPSFAARVALIRAIEGSDLKVVDPVLEKVKVAASTDAEMTLLREQILAGFPNEKCNLQAALRPYWCVRDRLAIDESDDMIVVGARVVIPKSLRAAVLRDLIQMHQGATKLRQRARMSVYWPNMDVDVANATRSCEECTKRLPSHPPEPLRPHEPASRPFEQLHADLGEIKGRHLLVIVDQFSGWPHVVTFPDKNTTARRTIDAVRKFFSNVGAPVKFWSDNGSNFGAAEFKKFLADWGVTPGWSSPGYAQSNGRAEAEIQSMKKIIEGCWTGRTLDENKLAKSILLFRNAPRLGGASPAQIVFGRPVRDCIPAHRRSFAAEWQQAADVLEKRARRAKELQIEHFNKKAHPLQPFAVGQHVLIQHPTTKLWATPGVIVEVGPNRDYLIKTPAGRIFRRNRRFLRRRIPVMPTQRGPTVPAPLPPAAEQQQQPDHPPDPAQQPEPQQERPPDPVRPRRNRQPPNRYPEGEWTR